MAEFNILIVDDHAVLRHGIVTLLNKNTTVNWLYEAKNGLEALTKCNEHDDIDIVFLDINMPDMDGIEVTKELKKRHPDIEIIAFSINDDKETVRNMLKAGASSYVLKSAGKKDINKAIENASRGKPFFSDEIAFKVLEQPDTDDLPEKPDNSTHLTDREIEILRLIVNEYTNQEIADKLYISKRTVDTHRTNLLDKTSSKNTAGLVRYAIKNNLA
jgi:DNA-binding NarL/FixJ family response regulator